MSLQDKLLRIILNVFFYLALETGKIVMKSVLNLLISLATAVASQDSPESCDFCVKGMKTFGQFALGDLAMDRQFIVLTDTFCLNTTDPAACGESVVEKWPPIVEAIASDDGIPVLVCQALKACAAAEAKQRYINTLFLSNF